MGAPLRLLQRALVHWWRRVVYWVGGSPSPAGVVRLAWLVWPRGHGSPTMPAKWQSFEPKVAVPKAGLGGSPGQRISQPRRRRPPSMGLFNSESSEEDPELQAGRTQVTLSRLDYGSINPPRNQQTTKLHK